MMAPGMTSQPLLLGPAALFAVGLYLAALLGIGIAARRARTNADMADFYLAGRGLGVVVLFLTLYATQYSGLTLVGFAGNFYRNGFTFISVVSFAAAIGSVYLWYAPRLQRLASERGYLTVGDCLDDRYGSSGLTLLATVVFVFALATYLLSNLKALGYVVEAATGGAVGFAPAVITLGALIVVYESLGGMRAVAWTDVLQGATLLVGCVLLFVVVVIHYGAPSQLLPAAIEARPELLKPPDLEQRVGWLSTLVLVAFGVSIYPHAIQRIYAARDAVTLRRAFQLMLLMPFVTTLLVMYVGYVGAVNFPGLDRLQSERIVFVVLADLAAHIAGIEALIALLVCAVIAAIMSTVDSALLAVSSLLTEDFYRKLRPQASERELGVAGRVSSFALMAAMIVLAITLPQTLWRITEVKLEVLCQAAPAIVWGLFDRRLNARAVTAGMAVGLMATVGLFETGVRPFGFHAGVVGLGANFAAVALVALAARSGGAEPATGAPSAQE